MLQQGALRYSLRSVPRAAEFPSIGGTPRDPTSPVLPAYSNPTVAFEYEAILRGGGKSSWGQETT